MIAENVIPTIKFYSAAGLDAPDVTREILFGVEEEGLPCEHEEKEGVSTAASLAFRAAEDSVLGVGIGLDNEGLLAVHSQKLPPDAPLFTVRYRIEGYLVRSTASNAARLVKGIPFMLSD